MHRLLGSWLIAAALAAAPATAAASTVGVQGATLTFTAAAGETNRVGVVLSGSALRITDGSRLRAAAGCTQAGEAVTCPRAGLTELVADLGDRSDRIDVQRAVTLRSRLRGGTGDDVLAGGGGPDEFDGGPGRDWASYSARSDGVVVSLSGGGPDGAPGEGDDAQVEQVAGTAGFDVLTGGGARERLEGRGGNDTLAGGGGTDTLVGGGGDDAQAGGDGNDVFLASSTPDGADVLSGGAGSDRADWSLRGSGVVADPDGRPDDGARPGGRLGFTGLVPAIALLASGERDNVMPDVESVRGGRGDDVLAAGRSGGRIEGGAGTDVVGGGPGTDVLDGGAGFDRLLARDGRADDLRCGSQGDRVFADGRDAPRGDCEATSRTFAAIPSPLARTLDGGALNARVACPAQAAVRCVGAVRLVTVRRLRTRAGRLRAVTLGAARFNAPAGTGDDVRIALTRAGRAALARLGGATRVRLVARGRDEAGPARPRAARLILRAAG
jgi:Ca2+-binding RTX toxin-like protein